jgi:hypothetical protein
MPEIMFTKWSGPDGIEQYIIHRTGCLPYSGAGINPRVEQKTTILKSVDNTYYYDDNMNDSNHVQYTLFGHNGDQDETERKFNEPLLNPDKTKHIYLYRVRKNKKNTEYIWYGKYEITGRTNKQHIGKDYVPRNIVVLSMRKIND